MSVANQGHLATSLHSWPSSAHARSAKETYGIKSIKVKMVPYRGLQQTCFDTRGCVICNISINRPAYKPAYRPA